MKVIILQQTMMGGAFYMPAPVAQDVPDDHAQHLIEIGNAIEFQTKVEVPEEKKSSSASEADQASPGKTAKKRAPRKRKSSSSTTDID